MRYVGIDPSTKTGLVILGEGNTPIVEIDISSKEKQDPQRFMDLADQITEQIRCDDVICIEGFSYGSKGRGVSTQYGIGWMIRVALLEIGFTYIDVPPSSLKKFATGKGNAAKDALVLPIFKKWGYEHKSDNVRDAYVLAKIAEAKSKEGVKLTDYQIESLKKVVI